MGLELCDVDMNDSGDFVVPNIHLSLHVPAAFSDSSRSLQ